MHTLSNSFTIPVTLEDGTIVSYINSALVEKQKRTPEQVEEICKLHVKKHDLFKIMEKAPVKDLPELADKATELEYQLQRAWGFPSNSYYHRFWEVPRCTCPKTDNEDRYPSGYYIMDKGCPVHGKSYSQIA